MSWSLESRLSLTVLWCNSSVRLYAALLKISSPLRVYPGEICRENVELSFLRIFRRETDCVLLSAALQQYYSSPAGEHNNNGLRVARGAGGGGRRREGCASVTLTHKKKLPPIPPKSWQIKLKTLNLPCSAWIKKQHNSSFLKHFRKFLRVPKHPHKSRYENSFVLFFRAS